MKKNRIYALVLTVLGVSCNVYSGVKTGDTIVETNNGLVQGVQSGEVISYKGIPYAQPPVGNLRWRAPQPIESWDGVFQANDYGHDCLEVPFPSDLTTSDNEMSENCLYLNVWKPAQPSRTLRPVIVWIHGGGFVNGSSSEPAYNIRAFARQGIVGVSFNYRLGRFGFFAHPALSNAQEDPTLGNYGFMDQIAALNWVKENVAQFGGDPNQVTVVGESAGGLSIHALLTSPLAGHLFDRAIIQSGAGRVNFSNNYLSKTNEKGDISAEEVGVLFAEKEGISGEGPDALQALRALPAEEILGNLNLLTLGSDPTYSGPMIDGKVVTAHPEDFYSAGQGLSVPLLVGATTLELPIMSFFDTIPQTKEEALSLFGPVRSEIARWIYGVTDETAPMELVQDIARDAGMVEPARFVMREADKQGQTIYGYRFGYVNDAQKATAEGAAHASDIAYAFNTVKAVYKDKLTESDQAMADMVHQYWVNFVRYGNPNGAGLPYWSRYHGWADNLMMFSNDGVNQSGMVRDPWQLRLDLIESIQ
ncbi:carboxylesterase/lipase family protein [Vibrio mangrovi]|uniref:Carboxylic ester hydrolase n=1 Tax=Vibrio mangrovi TaxID=474394 RepID=A0A1Y6J0A6_9VIBR|nr:carboxylesterase family protein [Vibrio mangrovi]MDW6004949.1 carboxylesterase family protein [Vibrio mangrovi]SMS01713.1 Para-nitrobenzyl esterase [Vibrio mangrovi]